MPTSIQGLSAEPAAARRGRGLGNAVAFKTGRSYLGILRKNVFTFINTVLFAISIVLILMGQFDDALITAGLMLLNALVGVYQEAQAKYKLDRLALQVRAMVQGLKFRSIQTRSFKVMYSSVQPETRSWRMEASSARVTSW